MTRDKFAAVIDIGSNSVRLMINEGGITLLKDVIITKLAEGSSVSLQLTVDAVDRTCNAIQQLYKRATEYTDEIYIFATEAVRRAENKSQLTERILSATGVIVDVISGNIEAEIGYIGATSGRDGIYTVIDVGGASTECVVGNNDGILYGKSMPIGSVKLTEMIVSINNDAVAIADRYIDSLDICQLKLGDIIAIGGTATTIASIQMALEVYDSSIVHNAVITRTELEAICNMLMNMSLIERQKVIGLQKERAGVITAGCIILDKLMIKLNKSELIVSESDNLEGYLTKIEKNKKTMQNHLTFQPE